MDISTCSQRVKGKNKTIYISRFCIVPRGAELTIPVVGMMPGENIYAGGGACEVLDLYLCLSFLFTIS